MRFDVRTLLGGMTAVGALCAFFTTAPAWIASTVALGSVPIFTVTIVAAAAVTRGSTRAFFVGLVFGLSVVWWPVLTALMKFDGQLLALDNRLFNHLLTESRPKLAITLPICYCMAIMCGSLSQMAYPLWAKE